MSRLAADTLKGFEAPELPAPVVERARPEVVVLPARPGVEPVDKPVVRIFLGTEPAQYRAERAFLWSIEAVRDPARVYEIHLMSGLSDFDKGGWTTSFTNYRFAIPELAGCEGRAIYNDEDQIYLADPAELFDLELGDHGFLAISDTESSVMLIDCARMADLWPLDAARTQPKKALLRAAVSLRGELDPAWNARDDEYREGESRLLHYSTLHTQPWRPFPERFVYQEQPENELWYELERDAVASGFHLFDRERPSREFAAVSRALASAGEGDRAATFGSDARELARRAEADSVLELGPSSLAKQLETRDASRHDAILVPDGLDRLPEEDVPWVVDSLFSRTSKLVYVVVATRLPPTRRRGKPPQGMRGTAAWWAETLGDASQLHPDVRWRLVCGNGGRFDDANLEVFRGGPRLPAEGMPRVWVLTDDRPGNTTQSVGLAEELGLPYEQKELRFGRLHRLTNTLIGGSLQNAILGASCRGLDPRSSSALEPPWPDVVIGAGSRTAPVSRWIRARSGGRTRSVQLGRKGANPPQAFDLSVAPAYCGLLPHPNRIETVGLLTRARRPNLEAAARDWGDRFDAHPRPHIGLVVGGSSRRHRLDAEVAGQLGREVGEVARRSGGSVFVITSRRTSRAAVAALREGLSDAALFYEWPDAAASSPSSGSSNPYLGALALADALIVTGESESMLAEACQSGRPVYIYDLPMREPGPLIRLKEAIVRRAFDRPENDRGTTRPQQRVEWLAARLLGDGILLPVRDFRRLHGDLVARGLAHWFEPTLALDKSAPPPVETLDEVSRVAAVVREMLGIPAEGDGACAST